MHAGHEVAFATRRELARARRGEGFELSRPARRTPTHGGCSSLTGRRSTRCRRSRRRPPLIPSSSAAAMRREARRLLRSRARGSRMRSSSRAATSPRRSPPPRSASVGQPLLRGHGPLAALGRARGVVGRSGGGRGSSPTRTRARSAASTSTSRRPASPGSGRSARRSACGPRRRRPAAHRRGSTSSAGRSSTRPGHGVQPGRPSFACSARRARRRRRRSYHVGRNVDPAALGPVPAHVRVERFVPQAHVLPRARRGRLARRVGHDARRARARPAARARAPGRRPVRQRRPRRGAGAAIVAAAGGADGGRRPRSRSRRVLDEPSFAEAAARIAAEIEAMGDAGRGRRGRRGARGAR